MRIQQPGTTLMPQVCTICGIKYMGGPTAMYCPTCRAEKSKEYSRRSKERQRAGKAIVLGETVGICAKCGEKFIYQGALQKYCKGCAEEAMRENDRLKSRGWLKRTTEKHGRQYADERNASKRVPTKHCKDCGASLAGMQPNREYCDDCQPVRVRYRQYIADIKRGKGKTAPLSFEEWRKGDHKKVDGKEIVREWKERNPEGTYAKCAAETGLCMATIGKWWRIIDEEAGIKRATPRELVENWRAQNPEGLRVECAADVGLCTETVGKWWRIIDEETGYKKKTSRDIVEEWRKRNPNGTRAECMSEVNLPDWTVRRLWRILDKEAGIKRATPRELVARWRKENPKGLRVECAAAVGLCKETVGKWWKIIDKEEKENGK